MHMLTRKRKTGSWRVLIMALLLMLALVSINACASIKDKLPGSAKAEAVVKAVDVQTGAEVDRVVIVTTPADLPYSVYKYADPFRVVVDIESASKVEAPSPIAVADGLIGQIEIASNSTPDKGGSVRVTINLERDAVYDVIRENDKLTVTIAKDSEILAKAKAAMNSPAAQAVGAGGPEDWSWSSGDTKDKPDFKNVFDADQSPAAPAPEPAAAPAPAIPPVEMTPADAPRDAAAKPATKLTGVKIDKQKDQTQVSLETDGAVDNYSSHTTANPNRLVVEIWGVENGSGVEQEPVSSQGVSELKAVKEANKVRMEFDVTDKMPSYRVEKNDSGVLVTFSADKDVALAGTGVAENPFGLDGADQGQLKTPMKDGKAVTPAAVTADAGAGPQDVPQSDTLDWGPTAALPYNDPYKAQSDPYPIQDGWVGIAYIDEIKFEYTPDASTIRLHADRPIRQEMYTREDNPDEQIITIFVRNSQVAADQQRSYDTKEFMGPIDLFSVFQRPTNVNETAIVIVMSEKAYSKYDYDPEEHILRIMFENWPGSLGLGGAAHAGAYGLDGETIFDKEAQNTVTLVFKNIAILDAIRIIAENSGTNIVVDENVKGNVTVKLEAVPWEQALDAILETKNLGKVRKGNIIRVADRKTLAAESKSRAVERKQEEESGQKITRIIPINYSRAEDIKRLLMTQAGAGGGAFKTKNGMVNSDKRTNSIIIKDIPEVVEEAENLIKQLDKPTAQVLIEARIVEATHSVSRTIGVQWGVGLDVGPATATPTGLSFPNQVQVGGATMGGIGNAPSYASPSSGGGGALGLHVGHLTNVVDLDVLLRALEAKEKIKIISSPRVMTVTDEEAVIEQGVAIAYPPPATSGGSATGGGEILGWTFKEASLRLQVTPHVTPDESIFMEIKASNNEPVTVPGSDAPGISRKEATTKILVNDGETAVIGGIYKLRDSSPTTQVPFLGDLPVIGPLFGVRQAEARNEELIIFLTPQIVRMQNRAVAEKVIEG